MTENPASVAILVDIAILLLIAKHIGDGVRQGFVRSSVDLVGFLLSIGAALTFYLQLGDWAARRLEMAPMLTRPLAFLALWIATGVVARIVGLAVAGPFARVLGGAGSSLDLLLSIVPGAVKGVVVSGFLLWIVLAVPPLPSDTTGADVFASAREGIAASTLASALVERTAGLDRFAREVVGDPIEQTLSVITVRPEVAERVELDFAVESPTIDPAAEEQLLALLNADRERAGLEPLVRDETIDGVARVHSIDMLERSYFAHETPDGVTPFDRMREGGVRFTAAGENLALAPTAALAHQGLMESPGHRANILRAEFSRVGIGAARADGRGRMFTQNFAG